MVIRKGPGRRLVYIAVGTVYRSNLDFFRTCMEALVDPSYTVILSVGRAVDPNSLGAVPANFTVAQYVPQLQVLQQADLFITHGGMNSVNEAVVYGAPMVLVPNTIEQTINASGVSSSCIAASTWTTRELTVETLRASVDKALNDPAASCGLPDLKRSFEEAGGAAHGRGCNRPIQVHKRIEVSHELA